MRLLPFVLLVAATAAWFLLPLIPALKELLRPSDAEPLTMVGQDAGDLTVFAEGFRGYLRRQFPEALTLGMETAGTKELSDGTPVVHLNGRPELLAELGGAERLISQLVVATSPVRLPGGETFLLEVYARDDFTGGPDAVYRALLGERTVQLERGSQVLRWVHAEGDLTVGNRSILFGRASSGGVMRLGTDVRFGRVSASRIIVGERDLTPPSFLPTLVTSTAKLPRTARQTRGFIRVDGDLEVGKDQALLGTVVVSGSIVVRNGARISGNVKVHGNCTLEMNAVIDGSLVSRGDVKLSSGSCVFGPIVAEGDVRLESGSSVGTVGHPASVAARSVLCGTGSQVFGAVAARADGRTLDVGSSTSTATSSN